MSVASKVVAGTSRPRFSVPLLVPPAPVLLPLDPPPQPASTRARDAAAAAPAVAVLILNRFILSTLGSFRLGGAPPARRFVWVRRPRGGWQVAPGYGRLVRYGRAGCVVCVSPRLRGLPSTITRKPTER